MTSHDEKLRFIFKSEAQLSPLSQILLTLTIYVVAVDGNRVRISGLSNNPGTADYINASYIDVSIKVHITGE